MCLLIYSWQPDGDVPLVVAANRDEFLDRPAEAFGILQDGGPRILGGRDLLAGGTWLAVNEHGLVAGLTNRPSAGGRDDSKRSRGELPLVAARQADASSAVEALSAAVEPGRYNPAAMLVGDRNALYALELAPDQPLVVTRLGPGLHVLENVPYGRASPKVDLVQAALATSTDVWHDARTVLADHTVTAPEVPEDPLDAPGGSGGSGEPGGSGDADGAEGPAVTGPGGGRLRVRADGTVVRPAGTSACCVHLDGYGTRSSALIHVPADGDGPIGILAADGSPCTAPYADRTSLWTAHAGS